MPFYEVQDQQAVDADKKGGGQERPQIDSDI